MLQTTIAPYVKINTVHPDLTLLLVIGWVILRGTEEGLTWALIGGLALDFTSAAPFGLFTITMLLVTLLTNLTHGLIFGSSIVLPLSLTFPLSIIFNGLALFVLYLLGTPIVWSQLFETKLLPIAIYNTAVMIFIFPLLYFLNKKLNPQPLTF